MLTRREFAPAAWLALAPLLARGQDVPRVVTLNDTFDFDPPKTAAEWVARRDRLRRQVQVAAGLWPMPVRIPLNAVVRAGLEANGVAIDKVHFESRPGHFVTGNLYRPLKTPAQPGPAILNPHGHRENGRLHEALPAAVKRMIAGGEEGSPAEARFFAQALPTTFARLGYTVFEYDMVGYAESIAIPHRGGSGIPHPEGFADPDAELHLQSLLGLQLWNSIRALDFLTSLPFVDARRIGITGSSGGGTQTFLLAAIDGRVSVAAPAVMVSTGMQGGCVCENCSLLRVGTGNVELAALFAPKPLALTGADDWTREIMTRGLPELRHVYKLLGAEQNVVAKAWVQFPHNYNRPAREFVYSWFEQHLNNKIGPVAEPSFVPVPVEQLRVFDEAHPRPTGELGAAALRAQMVKSSEAQLAKLRATGEADAIIRAALAAIIGRELPRSQFALDTKPVTLELPAAEFARVPVNPVYAGFTWCYNAPPLALAVRDALDQIEALGKPVTLIGRGPQGLVAVLAAALSGGAVTKLFADLQNFDWTPQVDAARFLPGALKYGGIVGFLAAVDCPATVWNAPSTAKSGPRVQILKAMPIQFK